MGIKLVNDVGAPLAVAVVDLVVSSQKPDWDRWVDYGMTILGYAGAFMNKGGDALKNVGIASLPLSAKQLYAQFQSMGKGASANPGIGGGVRNIGRVTRMAAKPEFANVVLY